MSVRDSRVKLIRLQEWISREDLMQAYKKKAIEIGISQATGTIILTTDGDCSIGENWVWSMLGAKEATGAKLITGPVMLDGSQTALEHFQSLDFMGMMGITAASLRLGMYNMANGANMLYEKEAFLKVDGFKGIDHKASGDDMLLVYKIAKAYNGAVAFAKTKDAIVRTEPMHSLNGFLQQRFRWTSKSADYQDVRITWILGLVYLSVLSILINLVAACFASTTLLWLVLVQWLIKSLVDIPLLNSTARWFGKQGLMKTFFSSQILHVAYIIGVGTLGNILKYQWKGRTLR
jgi:cellulose synthase/poly-beta-1,6-N-acetylglucosamine synthase-like glycosyltransferase